MSEATAFLLLKGWLTVSVLAFALNELRILRRDARAARDKAAAAVVPLPATPAASAPTPERRAA
jgi:putative copper export protein